jgi:acetaldehyde dehydrogenase/alcohol dehydrogenase
MSAKCPRFVSGLFSLLYPFTNHDIVCTTGVLIDMPSAQGAIGDLYNFKLDPSLTLGCGTKGGSAIAENLAVHHLLNIKTVAAKRENMMWFKVPQQIYFKRGILREALKGLPEETKRVMIVTDR